MEVLWGWAFSDGRGTPVLEISDVMRFELTNSVSPFGKLFSAPMLTNLYRKINTSTAKSKRQLENTETTRLRQRSLIDLNNYFTEMCSGFEAGSYLRLMDVVCHSTLGLRVITKREEDTLTGRSCVMRQTNMRHRAAANLQAVTMLA